MDNKSLVIIAAGFTLSFAAFAVISGQPAMESAANSVAWYTANLKLAQQQNKICHDNPDIRNSEQCINSLHALNISFNGAN